MFEEPSRVSGFLLKCDLLSILTLVQRTVSGRSDTLPVTLKLVVHDTLFTTEIVQQSTDVGVDAEEETE